MAVWAIADLHLSFGVPNKEMDFFGSTWINWTTRIEENWKSLIYEDDLVLIAGDISWAMRIEEVIPDLEWIHKLPGTKVILRGNHDYWWTSLSKIEKILPSSIHLIQNNVFNWKNISVGGSRLWDTSSYKFHEYIDYKENARAKKLSSEDPDIVENDKIFDRELSRLETSLKLLSKSADFRIAMTHYPPISADLQNSRGSELIEKYRVNACVFGHLHNVKQGISLFGTKNQITYYLTSCDYLTFKPIKILD
jgi:predicted phosphohydrolase